MSASAEPERSLSTRLCIAFFLVWVCHVGRSQFDDRWSRDPPECGRSINSSELEYNCTRLEKLLYRFCGSDNVTLETDPVAFVHSNSSVITHTNFTDINETALYYKLCLFVPTWDVFDGRYELRNCTYNGTELDLEVQWDRAGALNLSVFVFSEDQKDFLGCAKTGITVAENSGLELNVNLKNDPAPPSVNPAPFTPSDIDPSIDVDFLSDQYLKSYAIGSITFTCRTNRPRATKYFKYDFGDGESEPYTQDGNFTHDYSEEGVYEYTVDAVALSSGGSRGFHASHGRRIHIMEPVSNITMVANKDNTFQVNVESQVNISAHGTRPILACWRILSEKDWVQYPIDSVPQKNSSTTPAPTPDPDFICRQIINQSIFEPMQFTELGQFVFITVFGNNVSQAESAIKFQVIKNSSKVVVASTSTLVAVLAVLIAIVFVLMIVMTLYIPYRKYKARYTETANFKFVDLSESTHWDRARMKVREFVDKINRSKKPSKVGLVNEKNDSTKLMHFPYESVS